MKKLLFLFCLLLTGGMMWAQGENPWTDLDQLEVPKRTDETIELPDHFRLVELDVDKIQSILDRAPFSVFGDARSSQALLDLPMPDGSTETFRISRTQTMHPDLAAQYPTIASYMGVSLEPPFARVAFGFSPLGWQGVIFPVGTDPVFLMPVSGHDNRFHLSYYSSEFPEGIAEFECGVTEASDWSRASEDESGNRAGDCQPRVYRLAMAATAEFTAFFGGTINTAATINALVTIINGIYQPEHGIQFNLVAGNNALIQTDTTVYSNGNAGSIAGENQGIVDGAIGSGNYDVGHVLGTVTGGFSGVSQGIGTACGASKARASSSAANPALTNPFMVFMVLHELGHQMGADHTFNENSNGSCGNGGQFNGATAMEPGSGSTIMSYAGICGASNIFNNAGNLYFHSISLQQVGNFITGGGNCATNPPLGNNPPVVAAGDDEIIPISTPFLLTAIASDPDGAVLQYCWEQMNNEVAVNPPVTTATEGPVFRSFPPTASPTRYFPNLPSILAGTPSVWEVLPAVARTANFRCSVRDNLPTFGCTAEDDIEITFDNSAGPFTVNDPSGLGCFNAEEEITITWNVANTTGGNVNCPNVDILLSTDGGQTFPLILADETPNDGSHVVSFPAVITNQARIMVRGSGRIFFNINPNDFLIDCVTSHEISDPFITGTYKAKTEIYTSGPVSTFGTVRFYAGEEIRLNPGFRATLGSDFLARIQPCDACDLSSLAENGVVERSPSSTDQVWFRTIEETEQPLSISVEDLKMSVYPNPSFGQFQLQFELPAPLSVTLELYDLNGRPVQTIYRDQLLPSGVHQTRLEAKGLPAGMYWCKLRAGQWEQVERLVILE